MGPALKQKIPFRYIIKEYTHIDIIDMDIQGEEANAILESIDSLNNKVRKLHIGTHSHKIESKLRVTLSKAGWVPLLDYSCKKVNETVFGTVMFPDGIQTRINPKKL